MKNTISVIDRYPPNPNNKSFTVDNQFWFSDDINKWIRGTKVKDTSYYQEYYKVKTKSKRNKK